MRVQAVSGRSACGAGGNAGVWGRAVREKAALARWASSGCSGPSGVGRARGDVPVAWEQPRRKGERAAREKWERRAGWGKELGRAFLLGPRGKRRAGLGLS